MRNRLFILLLFFSYSSFAQDTLGVQEVQVTESYIPEVPISKKITDFPEIEDTFKIPLSISYLLNSKQYITSFSVDTISPAKIKGEFIQKIYPTYIKLAIGNDAVPNFDIFYSSDRNKTLSYGARIGYRQSFMKANSVYNNEKTDAHSSHTNLNLFAKKNFDFATVYSRFYRMGDQFTSYGLDPELQLTKSDLNQYWGYSNLDIGIYSTKNNLVNYNSVVSISDLNEQTESSISLKSNFEGKYNGHNLSLDLKLDYFANNFANDVSFDTTKTEEYLYSFAPKYHYLFNGIEGKYGVNIVYNNNLETNITAIYPDIYLEYFNVESVFNTYFGINGGLKHNSYWSFSKENPFVLNALDNGNSSLILRNSDINYNIYSGFGAKLSSQIEMTSKISFAKIDQMPFFELDNQSIYNNKFKVVYDDGSHLHFRTIIDWDFGNEEGVIVDLNYHNYTLENLDSYSYKPTFSGAVTAKYNIGNKIITQAKVFGELNRTVTKSDINNLTSLKDFVDLNVSVEYRFSKVFSSYIKANNLIGGYQLWQNYYTLSPRLQFGLLYRY